MTMSIPDLPRGPSPNTTSSPTIFDDISDPESLDGHSRAESDSLNSLSEDSLDRLPPDNSTVSANSSAETPALTDARSYFPAIG